MVVHNTSYIVGHLHLTVGTAVTLTFMGISYWLVPHLARRALFSRALALVQVWLWFGGMLIFSPTLHELGLRGMPRRTMIGHVSYMQPEWKTLLPLVGIGGAILFVSATLFFLNMILTATVSRGARSRSRHSPTRCPDPIMRPPSWIAGSPGWRAAVILIVIAYGPTLVRLAVTTPLTTPGLRVW